MWVVNATTLSLNPPGRDQVPGVGARAGLDDCGKSRLQTGFDTRRVQPVASRYTERAVPVHDFVERRR